MALEKASTVDLVEVAHNGTVQVRTRIDISDSGVVISSTFNRHTVVPGQDYSAENIRVKAVCAAVHTPDVVAAFAASLPTQGA